MLRNFAVSLAALFLVPLLLVAQEGKVRGKVTDKETGEPLIGANVTVVGTSLGAATDVNGEYVIVTVGVGTYQMRATYVGYQPLTISNVRVNEGLTSEANFMLSSTSVAAPAVEIVATRPLVNKSATSSVRIIDGEFITKLPSRGINAAIDLQPGVVDQAGNYYIRGGRYDETGFTIDGVSVTNVIGGGRGVTVIDEAVEQVQVLTGGYGAEFGGANAGIVRTDLRTGRENLNASLLFESDGFASAGKKFLGTYSYKYRDLTGTIGGPLGTEQLRFFASYQNTYNGDPVVRGGWQGVNFPGLVTSPNKSVFQTPAQQSVNNTTDLQQDTINLVYPAGNFIGGYNQNNNVAGTLLADLGTVKVRFGGSYAFNRYQDAAGLGTMFDQSRLPMHDRTDGFANLKLTQFLTPTTYYEASFNYMGRSGKDYDPQLKDNLFAYGDSAANAALGYTYRANAIEFPLWYIGLGNPVKPAGYLGGFDQPGTELATYAKFATSSVGGRLDLTSQLESRVEMKVGGEYTRYTYRTFNPASVINWASDVKDNHLSGDSLIAKLRGYGPNNLGYDVFGNEISDDIYNVNGDLTDLGPRHPVFAGAYVQSKIELTDIIMNLGLRYDYIKADDQTVVDPTRITKNDSLGLVSKSNFTATPARNFVTPRLGFSFPATDRTVFHATYAKLVQQPRLNDSYAGIARTSYILEGGNFFTGTTGYGLRPERTTSYEIGLQQLVSENASFDITAFYKDIIDQIQYYQVLPAPGASQESYPVFINGDFATTKGVEFKLTMRRTNRAQIAANLTLSDSKGTGSTSTTLAGAAVTGTAYIPKFVFPNTFNEPVRGNVSLDYRFAKDDGGPVLEELGVNLLANFNSGTAVTRITNQNQSDSDPRNLVPSEEIGASSTGWFFQLDGRIDKTVHFGPVNADIYIYVQNILGTNNIVNVFRKTGSATDDGWLGLPGGIADVASWGADAGTYKQLYNQIINVDANNFGPPRQIRLGIRLEY